MGSAFSRGLAPSSLHPNLSTSAGYRDKMTRSWHRACISLVCDEGFRMIFARGADTSRIFVSYVQILRRLESARLETLLKAFFNGNPLIFAVKCRHSAGPSGLEIGIEP